MSIPTAWSYDDDVHCPDCAEERFGDSPEEAEDTEGNPVEGFVVWDWDYDDECDRLVCGTCLCELDSVHVEPHSEYCRQYDPGAVWREDDPEYPRGALVIVGDGLVWRVRRANADWVTAVAVGDDHRVDHHRTQVTRLDEDADVCSCGQLGCEWGGGAE